MTSGPSQALNLGGQPSAYGDAFSALNLFHGADAWIWLDANGDEQRGGVSVDAKGWLTELPVRGGVAQTVWANVFYTKIMPAGDYIVEWTGEGSILPWQDYERIGPNKLRIHFEANYAAGDDGITLRIESTDPNQTGDYIRDIEVYQEKYADLVAMGEDFDPNWFQAVNDFRILRTHDWQGTNFSKVTGWTADGVTADQAFWVKDGRGMPFELLVQMANETRSDLWINIPHMATDDYMRKTAAYVKEHLDSGLRVYVEYTNEYWTTIFDQHQYLIDKGAERFGSVPFANAQAYAARASEMTQIFKQVFGADGARLFPVVTLDSAAFNTAEATTMLNAPAYVAQGGLSPLAAGIRFLATDGYFGWYNTDPATDAMVDRWIAMGQAGFAAARDFLLDQIANTLAPDWALGRALADQFGIAFGGYEGGALLLNGGNPTFGDPRYTNFSEAFQLSPEMKQVYEAALAAWQATSSGPMAWYSDVGRWGPWGDYGLWNAPDFTPEPRTEAIIDANTDTAPWWTGDSRPAATFDYGLYDAGTPGADSMTGTSLADRLYGLPGNDTLSGLAGDDRLVGGVGNDTLSGGAGDHTMAGGFGADTYLVDSPGDIVDEASNAGMDIVNTALNSFSLFSIGNVERLVFTGTGNFIGRGNGLDNRVQGGPGNDRFVADQGGADRYFGGTGAADTMDFHTSAAGAIVNLTTGVHGGAAAGDFFSSIECFYGSDGGGDDFTGGAFNDRFDGYAGNDSLRGLGGSDTINGGNGDDEISGGALLDFLAGNAGADDFNYAATSDSGPSSGLRDRVIDFEHPVDDIDVSAIDARAGTAGNNAFTQFIGAAAFTAEGQIRAFQSGAHAVIEFNTAGAGGAEMQIQLNNFIAATLTLADFIA